MKAEYPLGSIVWARISTNWWPGTVTDTESCPVEFVKSIKKEPLVIVKFFNEQDFFDIHKQDTVLSYNCSRKDDLIKKGINSLRHNGDLLEKFEADVLKAEKLSGGNQNIIVELKTKTKRKIDYIDMGFGTPKAKKPAKDESVQREGFSNIDEAIQYKKGSGPTKPLRTIEHQVKILEQPKPDDNMKAESNWFKCYICGFTCVRLNVIIWHNKSHLLKVDDYDSGIKIPGRRKRKQPVPKSRSSKTKPVKKVDNEQKATNGHVSPPQNAHVADELLQDWADDEETDKVVEKSVKRVSNNQASTLNGVTKNDEGSDYDENFVPVVPKSKRQPMPNQKVINSAFDALLAESPGNAASTPTSHNSHYVNNDSDSDGSDWEKYYDQDSNSPVNGDPVSDVKPICENNSPQDANGTFENGKCDSTSDAGDHSQETPLSPESEEPHNAEEDVDCPVDNQEAKNDTDSNLPSPESPEPTKSVQACDSHEVETDISSSTKQTQDPVDKNTEEIHSDEPKIAEASQSQPKQQDSAVETNESESTKCDPTPTPSVSAGCESSKIGEGTQEARVAAHCSSNPSSGPAYMLVAVDAQGNNVPMPVLSEGGNNLVAVEASMEDGTTRTLYIDPAHLGPNVDLNNLMLHIDNTGEETVYIASSNDNESSAPTIVDQHNIKEPKGTDSTDSKAPRKN